MVKKEKIFELKIEEDDELSGIDSISLVDVPAIEVNWMAFKDECNGTCHMDHDFSEDDEKFVSHIMNNAETEDDLLNEGWVIDNVEIITGKENFVSTNPNAVSGEDEKEYKVRYKYMLNPDISGPAIISTSRPFCRQLIAQNKVFRVEDIESAVNDFGQSPLVYRGSWNCRHVWARLTYRNDVDIINKASVNKGKIDPLAAPDTRVLGYDEPSTITNVVRNAVANGTAAPRTASHLGLSKQEMGYDNNLPAYVDEIPTGKTESFESYNDYPDSAKNNACKVLRWRDEHKDEVKGMTQVGWTRANQLCNGENISEETIARMASFARHRENAEVSPEFKDTPWKDKGYVAWLGWGGTTGVEWAQDKLESIRNNMSKQNFSVGDEDQQIILGPAMIPNQKIFRKGQDGQPYYVFFSPQTISMISEKYMKNKYTDNNDQMHDGKAVKDVYVLESWIKEDMEYDKGNKYGYGDLPIGTWFVSMRVNNPEIWKKIKAGELNGFSVSGWFSEEAMFSREEMFLHRLADLLKVVPKQ
jgi:hypothetical protein